MDNLVFKKHNWMTYGKKSHIIEITLRDENGGKMDFFRCNNNEGFKKVALIIKNKYGFDAGENKEMNINENFEEEKSFLDKEMEW